MKYSAECTRHPSPFQLLPYGIARCQFSLPVKYFWLKLMHSDYLVWWIPNFFHLMFDDDFDDDNGGADDDFDDDNDDDDGNS